MTHSVSTNYFKSPKPKLELEQEYQQAVPVNIPVKVRTVMEEENKFEEQDDLSELAESAAKMIELV